MLLTALVLPLLYFHVPYTRSYVVQAAALYVFNGVTRSLACSPAVPVTVEAIPGTSLLRLKADAKATSYLSSWTAGQHIYLKHSHSPLSVKTPFTVVRWSRLASDGSGKLEASSIELVVRNTGGPQTGWLGSLQQEQKANLLLEGPYGESKTYLPLLLQQLQRRNSSSDAVLLVAGGVGATYTLPLYLALLEASRSSANISFVWFVRSRAEAAWGVDLLRHTAPCDVDLDAAVYITRRGDDDDDDDDDDDPVSLEKEAAAAAAAAHQAPNPDPSPGSSKQGIRIYPPRQRAHLVGLVDAVFARGENGVYVFACGPARLAAEVREKVGVHVTRDARDVRYHEERFGLGAELS